MYCGASKKYSFLTTMLDASGLCVLECSDHQNSHILCLQVCVVGNDKMLKLLDVRILLYLPTVMHI